ncbi:MAG: L-threonylcarbamoyladenylate synthase [bacterium]
MDTIIVERSFHSLEKIIDVLERGGVVILPSENVYGFAVKALSKEAVDRVYELKGREKNKPLVYFTSKRKAEEYGIIDDNAKKIIDLWPEGVGIIVPKKDNVPSYVTAGKDSIMLVCVDEFLESLADKASFPIAGTSANKSGEKENIKFDSVDKMFNGRVSMIVKGGKCKRGQSGTIINLSVKPPTVLREGPFSTERIRELIPNILVSLL